MWQLSSVPTSTRVVDDRHFCCAVLQVVELYSSKDAAGGTLSPLLSITMGLGEDNLLEETISVSLIDSL